MLMDHLFVRMHDILRWLDIPIKYGKGKVNYSVTWTKSDMIGFSNASTLLVSSTHYFVIRQSYSYLQLNMKPV